MKSIKQLALVAAMSSIGFGANAMTAMQDTDLSLVNGQDGVSIAADLHVNIGSFVYTQNQSSAPISSMYTNSIAFKNIAVSGQVAATIDIIDPATFGLVDGTVYLGLVTTEVQAVLAAAEGGTLAAFKADTTNSTSARALAQFTPLSDVVKIAMPTVANSLNITVARIQPGTLAVTAPMAAVSDSFGSIAITGLNLGGTKAYMFAQQGDGIGMAAALNVNIGAFSYTDTNATAGGGTMAFNNIKLTGAFAAAINVMSNANFVADLAAGGLGGITNAGLGAFAPAATADVVKFALPNITTSSLLNMSVGSITAGAKSFGGIQLNQIALAGTTAYIWAH